MEPERDVRVVVVVVAVGGWDERVVDVAAAEVVDAAKEVVGGAAAESLVVEATAGAFSLERSAAWACRSDGPAPPRESWMLAAGDGNCVSLNSESRLVCRSSKLAVVCGSKKSDMLSRPSVARATWRPPPKEKSEGAASVPGASSIMSVSDEDGVASEGGGGARAVVESSRRAATSVWLTAEPPSRLGSVPAATGMA
jgi:hypothetical protein